MVTPGRRIASPSFPGVVADPTPVAHRARPAHLSPHVAGRGLGPATEPHSAPERPCVATRRHVNRRVRRPGGAASGLSCLPEAIHRALRKEAGGGQL